MLPPGSALLPKSGKALPVTDIRQMSVFFNQIIPQYGSSVNRDDYAIPVFRNFVIDNLGVAFPSMVMPEPAFLQILPRTSPEASRAIEMPLPSFSIHVLLRMTGLALPVAKTPSRLHLVNVQLATVGLVDSIQTPVPRLAKFVTVTPRSSALLSSKTVTFCRASLGLLYCPLPSIKMPLPLFPSFPTTLTPDGTCRGKTSPFGWLLMALILGDGC
jgi:hypothetical protein